MYTGFAAMVAAGMVHNIAADVDLFLYYSYTGYTLPSLEN